MIALIDYGAGNLFSVRNALKKLNAPCVVTSDKEVLKEADGIILPGVGAFPQAMERLKALDLVEAIRENAEKKPFLGICLGMQLLFTTGYEFEQVAGLDLIPGEVRLLRTEGLKIPHMGWNDLTILNSCAMTEPIKNGDYVYFVHSYGAVTAEENISAYTVYGQTIPALVHKGHVYGAQFHPEKSGDVGLSMLKSFVDLVEDCV